MTEITATEAPLLSPPDPLAPAGEWLMITRACGVVPVHGPAYAIGTSEQRAAIHSEA